MRMVRGPHDIDLGHDSAAAEGVVEFIIPGRANAMLVDAEELIAALYLGS